MQCRFDENQRLDGKGPCVSSNGPTPGVYRIVQLVGPLTFRVADIAGPEAPTSFMQPLLHAERLVKLDIPELELDDRQPRRLETKARDGEDWELCEIERFAADGRVQVRPAAGGDGRCVGLSVHGYRSVARVVSE